MAAAHGNHDEISFLTGDTDLQMNPDGTCVRHPDIKMRETTEDGYVYQRETCPQCEAELDSKLDAMNQKRHDLDQENLDLKQSASPNSSKSHNMIQDESDDQGWTHPQKMSLEALSTQMNRMQQMQDWLLQQKEQEMAMLRQKVEDQQRELIQKEVEMALLKEKLAQQESRMQHELKLIKAAASKHRKRDRKKKHKEEDRQAVANDGGTKEKQVITETIMDSESNRKSGTSRERTPQGSRKSASSSRDRTSRERRRSRSGDNSVGETPMISQAFEEHMEEMAAAVPSYGTKVPPPPPPEDDFVEDEVQDQFDVNNVAGVPLNINNGPSTVPFNEQLTMDSFGGYANKQAQDNSDAFTMGNTVASSTYGEDRHKVVNQTVLDPYGDSGQYTGVVLLTTGMPHGLGRMLYEDDGRTYEGDWRHGRWHGFGRATFANGDAYEGEYRFDQRHGRGLYQWHDGRQYDGDFYEDKRHGRGVFKWPDGAIYEGDFVHGQREGHGRYTFSDGGQYVGDWVDGRYEGYGECEWEDGRSYKGEWTQGVAHGRGVETFADGTVRHDGLWDHDEPILE